MASAIVAIVLAITACAARGDEPTLDFDRDIQPMLARCVLCHGPGTHEAGLRLDFLEGAAATLESGNRALVPGDVEQSALLARVSAEDPAERMPPMGEPLSPAQIETLRRWIAAGAEWPAHWAYRPLVPQPVPAVPDEHAGWPRTPIDHFILQKLAERGLGPSPEADKRTLLRRLSFDLVGLPPTPEELEAFLADDSAEAYDRAVERLLASPHYGERWARHWMDVVHFAETHGNDQDRPRPNAWPYRDWLIRSFNDDKPYARFVAEQVAGDALFPGDPESIVATGFLATGPWDESSLRDINENGIDREIARYLDRDDIVTTVMSTFVSSTVHCARCHDHKFDPIAQREYYALQAVFAATDKSDRAYDADPAVGQRRRKLAEQLAALPALRDAVDPALLDSAVQAEVADWERSLGDAASIWTVVEDLLEFRSAEGATMTKLPDGSILASGKRPEKDTYTFKIRTPLTGITGLRLELLTDESLPHGGPGRQDNGNLHLSELTMRVAPASDGSQTQSLRVASARSDFDQEGWGVALALDGNPATAWGIYPQVGQPHVAAFEIVGYPEIAGDALVDVRLEQLHGSGHTIGRLRLSLTNVPLPLPVAPEVLPAEVAEALRTPPEARSDAQRATLAAHILRLRCERELAALPPQQMVYCGSNKFTADGSFRPAATPRTVYVLDRGNIATPLEEAEPGALSCLPDLAASFDLPDPQDEGARRAALARWLTDERNVLAWRSIVNRVWHYHFGRGLCDTPNDFGRMGAAPSHRELLDWLACEFRGGGSLKELHRQMVRSAAYRQSSAHRADYAALDGDNRLLWRMNRGRLDAESIRDAVLVVSGKLDPTLGGPSVKQFIQSPGVHVTPVVDYLRFDADDPANFRRSVYRFIFRTLPDPFMDSLDCADSSQLTPARNTSVTALQALSMLNNKFIVRQSEHLAERLQAEAADPAGQIARLYRLALLREPTPEESAAFVEYASRHGLANACRVLLNSNEFMFVN